MDIRFAMVCFVLVAISYFCFILPMSKRLKKRFKDGMTAAGSIPNFKKNMKIAWETPFTLSDKNRMILKRIWVVGKIGLLLIVFGFFMPVACNQNAFQVAEYVSNMSGNSSGTFLRLLVYALFAVSAFGVINLIFFFTMAGYGFGTKPLGTTPIKKNDTHLLFITEIIIFPIASLVFFMLSNLLKEYQYFSMEIWQSGAYIIVIGVITSFLSGLTGATKHSEMNVEILDGMALNPANDNDTRKCPYCAEIIKKEAVVCRFCGKEIEKEEMQNSALNKKTCKRCGKEIDSNYKSCPYCEGNDFDTISTPKNIDTNDPVSNVSPISGETWTCFDIISTPKNIDTNDPVSNVSPISGETWTCKKCNETNPISSSICKGCGAYK